MGTGAVLPARDLLVRSRLVTVTVTVAGYHYDTAAIGEVSVPGAKDTPREAFKGPLQTL